MLSILLWSSWVALAAYGVWFLFRAKTFQPLVLDDLALSWRLHKQESGCQASRIHSLITKNGEVIGFKCQCGHKFLQERLITQKAHLYAQTGISSLKSLADKKTLPKVAGSLQNLGIQYSHIQEI